MRVLLARVQSAEQVLVNYPSMIYALPYRDRCRRPTVIRNKKKRLSNRVPSTLAAGRYYFSPHTVVSPMSIFGAPLQLNSAETITIYPYLYSFL